ncbi:sugar ABC transporter substrate-binding protein [Salibacterium salarium]|uniref:Sugar ABC transporter substrate-binding protein n=1 Tax=Salibacterium salarium TaxID=284579 RepID=A0A3R9WRB1_9BACI|nr:sugar ABC transporter substrate-binding protein [Salibacterium salarium]RSL31932.1 sugar ABC transporter substrate-binding protein [Salibacterium salarium]
MKKSKKIQLKSLLSICMLASLTACGGSSDEESSSPGDNQEADSNNSEKIELRFSWWGDTGRNEIYNEIADRFEEENPNITIARETSSFNDYWNRLTTQVAGNNGPDVVSMHGSYVSDYARRGALLSLEEYIESGTIDLEYFTDAAVDSGKIDDAIYMIAKGITMSGVMYNTAIFDEYGIDYPEMGWTWEEFMNTSIKLTEEMDAEDRWGVAEVSGQGFRPAFQKFVRQKGGELFTEEGDLGFSEDDVIAWWEMWDELRQEGAIPDGATITEDESAALEESLFVSEKVALSFQPANQLDLYQQEFSDGEINMVTTPTFSDGEEGEFVEGAHLAITEASEHPKEAAQFINFFVNSEKSQEIFKVEQGSSGSTEIQEFTKPLLNEAEQKTVDFNNETLEVAETAPYPPEGVSEIEQIFWDYATDISFGSIEIEEAAENFMNQAESVLN